MSRSICVSILLLLTANISACSGAVVRLDSHKQYGADKLLEWIERALAQKEAPRPRSLEGLLEQDTRDTDALDDEDLQAQIQHFVKTSCRCDGSKCHCVTDTGEDFNDLPAQVQRFVQTTCQCFYTKCKCTTSEGKDVTKDAAKMAAILLREDAQLEARIQSSLRVKIKRFFRDGFRRLKETFTRTPVVKRRHHHSLKNLQH